MHDLTLQKVTEKGWDCYETIYSNCNPVTVKGALFNFQTSRHPKEKLKTPFGMVKSNQLASELDREQSKK